MAYEIPDLTAPYRKAVDVTSRHLMPALANSPQEMAARAMREGAGNLYQKYLRGPMQRGGQIMKQGLSGMPGVGPVGVMKDVAGMMAPPEATPPAAQPPQAAPAAAPAAMNVPPAVPAPPPPAMPGAAPGAAAGATAAPPAVPPADGGAPIPQPTAQAPGDTMPAPRTDDAAAMRDQQDALDAYYASVIGTGPGQRRSQQMQALASQLRGAGGGRMDWGSQLAQGIEGVGRGFAIHRGLSEEEKREKTLEEATAELLRRRKGEPFQLSGPGME